MAYLYKCVVLCGIYINTSVLFCVACLYTNVLCGMACLHKCVGLDGVDRSDLVDYKERKNFASHIMMAYRLR